VKAHYRQGRSSGGEEAYPRVRSKVFRELLPRLLVLDEHLAEPRVGGLTVALSKNTQLAHPEMNKTARQKGEIDKHTQDEEIEEGAEKDRRTLQSQNVYN